MSKEFSNNSYHNQSFSLELSWINIIKELRTKQSGHLATKIQVNLNKCIHINMSQQTQTAIRSASFSNQSTILLLHYLIFFLGLKLFSDRVLSDVLSTPSLMLNSHIFVNR